MQQAVITGDLINSTKIRPETLANLFHLLEKEITELQQNYKLIFEIYRGDSFQCLVEDPVQGLRISLILKTFFRGLNLESLAKETGKKNKSRVPGIDLTGILDARIALSIANLENLASRLAISNGEAFQLSGRLLDQIKTTKQHIIIGSADNFNPEWQTESMLLDALLSKTTSLQCQVLLFKLKGLTEAEIGKKLKIGQSAVNQRATSGNWNALNAMLKRFEDVYHHA